MPINIKNLLKALREIQIPCTRDQIVQHLKKKSKKKYDVLMNEATEQLAVLSCSGIIDSLGGLFFIAEEYSHVPTHSELETFDSSAIEESQKQQEEKNIANNKRTLRRLRRTTKNLVQSWTISDVAKKEINEILDQFIYSKKCSLCSAHNERDNDLIVDGVVCDAHATLSNFPQPSKMDGDVCETCERNANITKCKIFNVIDRYSVTRDHNACTVQKSNNNPPSPLAKTKLKKPNLANETELNLDAIQIETTDSDTHIIKAKVFNVLDKLANCDKCASRTTRTHTETKECTEVVVTDATVSQHDSKEMNAIACKDDGDNIDQCNLSPECSELIKLRKTTSSNGETLTPDLEQRDVSNKSDELNINNAKAEIMLLIEQFFSWHDCTEFHQNYEMIQNYFTQINDTIDELIGAPDCNMNSAQTNKLALNNSLAKDIVEHRGSEKKLEPISAMRQELTNTGATHSRKRVADAISDDDAAVQLNLVKKLKLNSEPCEIDSDPEQDMNQNRTGDDNKDSADVDKHD